MSSSGYIGRFAPSPSGPLHSGSLIAALGSYLRARSQQGKWLVRIEDIDPPREVAGASDCILKTLTAHGLHWDDSVLYQSSRTEAYEAEIAQLLKQNHAYYCRCTRKQVREMGGCYDGRCRQLTPRLSQGALRIVNSQLPVKVMDLISKEIKTSDHFASEDFIIKRRDGLYAYQLAVVIDDAAQGITEVVRGRDLLNASVHQTKLFNQLGHNVPRWLHLPLVCAANGTKLSKQNHARAINDQTPQINLKTALAFLGQPDVDTDCIENMLAQATAQFDISAIPQ